MSPILKESIYKSIFGAVPHIGGLLNEVFFDNRSRIVQNRVNSFVLNVKEAITNLGLELDKEHIESEDFLDLFSLIVSKVTEVKQHEKIEILKNVLLNEAIEPYKGGLRDSFIHVAMTLQPEQIKILIGHSKIKHDPIQFRLELQNSELLDIMPLLDGFDFNMQTLEMESLMTEDFIKKAEIEGKKAALQREKQEKAATLSASQVAKSKANNALHEKLKEDMPYREAEYYGLSQTEYLYFSQDMIAKCLLCDIGVSGHWESKPMEYFAITDYGKEFLNFLKLI